MGSLFSKPKMPKPQAPARMPDEEDPAIIEARRKRAAEAMRRSGRGSTILTGAGGTKLGGAG